MDLISLHLIQICFKILLMEQIIELLREWDAYSKVSPSTSLSDFGEWLSSKSKKQDKVYSNPFSGKINGTFGFHFGKLLSYAEAWERLTFRNHIINGFSDFFILRFIEYQGTPSKNEVANASREENTTVFEAIKRLTRKSLLKETIDTVDRRVRRVSITEKGAEVLKEIDKSALNMANLMVGDLAPNQIEEVSEYLKMLGDFHEKLYYSMTKEEIAEKYNL